MSEPVYRTRSGRVVRQVPRYEPDENTIFDDEESSDSDCPPVNNQEGGNLTDGTDDTASLSGSDSSLSDVMSLSSSDNLGDLDDEVLDDEDLDDEDLDDVLDWDRLTDDANTSDESSEDEEFYDDDEEDTETL